MPSKSKVAIYWMGYQIITRRQFCYAFDTLTVNRSKCFRAWISAATTSLFSIIWVWAGRMLLGNFLAISSMSMLRYYRLLHELKCLLCVKKMKKCIARKIVGPYFRKMFRLLLLTWISIRLNTMHGYLCACRIYQFPFGDQEQRIKH